MIGYAFFVGFRALAHDIKTFLLYFLLLPINAVCLRQMLTLAKKARTAAQGDSSMEAQTVMTDRKHRKGDILFKKGDPASEMLLTATGRFLVSQGNRSRASAGTSDGRARFPFAR
jgi:hypothetical protein